MARLKTIEELQARLGYEHEPKWIRGYTEREQHLSGALREMEEQMSNPDISLDDIEMDIRAILEEAAETLDDAHEEWLSLQLAARDLVGDINEMHMPEEDDDYDETWFGQFTEAREDWDYGGTVICWPNLDIAAKTLTGVLQGKDYFEAKGDE